MKSYAICLLLFILFASSCKKAENPVDNGCISYIKRHYITGADSLTAVNLLKQNNIPSSNLAYDRIILNDTVTNGSSTDIYQHIFAIQYFNGLQLFFSEIGYHFKNGVLQPFYDTRFTNIFLNTLPRMTLPEIRKVYVNALFNDANTNFRSYKDTCLVAEFGYFNTNTADTSNPKFVKAWYITPKNSLYPMVILNDNTGQQIDYFDGIFYLD